MDWFASLTIYRAVSASPDNDAAANRVEFRWPYSFDSQQVIDRAKPTRSFARVNNRLRRRWADTRQFGELVSGCGVQIERSSRLQPPLATGAL